MKRFMKLPAPLRWYIGVMVMVALVLSVAGACAGPAGMVRYAGAAAEYVKAHHPSVIPTGSVAEAGRAQARPRSSPRSRRMWAL